VSLESIFFWLFDPILCDFIWKRSLLRERGFAIGQEHAGKGVNISLSLEMNLARIPQGRRNWEAFGADPFLVNVGAYEAILGLQSGGVQAVAKQVCGNK